MFVLVGIGAQEFTVVNRGEQCELPFPFDYPTPEEVDDDESQDFCIIT